jgi:arsenite methyltransferase
MQTNEQLKSIVKEKYGDIAQQSSQGCGCSCDCSDDFTYFNEDYAQQEGYYAEADLGLGCGIPTQHAQIKEGDTVLDLGSGAGNDVFVARSLVGDSGKVIGVDMTEEMIEKARQNQTKLGYQNVEFRFGEIEDLPVADKEVDVIVSNCVLNLVPDKARAFKEMYRVLKPGGHFCVSDIVLNGELPEKLKSVAEMYAGCVTGAIQKNDYLQMLQAEGFVDVAVKEDRQTVLSDEVLEKYLTREEIETYRNTSTRIDSITVYGEKPF